jgi:AraC-like DNA-binding protein
MMKDNIKYILLFIFFSMLPVRGIAARLSESYSSFLEYTTENLYKTGFKYETEKNMPDSALMCYTIVANRYNKKMSIADKKYCARAYMGVWFITFFYYYYDYAKAYESLLKASDICRENHIEIPMLYVDLGCVYQTVFDQNNDYASAIKAISFFKKGFYKSVKNHETYSADLAFTNIVTVASAIHRINDIKDVWNVYDKLTVKSNDVNQKYNRLMYLAKSALDRKNYDLALSYFDKQLSLTGKDVNSARYKYISMSNKADVYAQKGDYAMAIKCMKEPLNIAMSSQEKDMQMECYNILADYYGKVGNQSQSAKYVKSYYLLKDSILNRQQIAKLNEIHFLDKINSMGIQMERLNQRRQLQTIFTVVVILITLFVIAFLIVLFRKNKHLRVTIESLYMKNMEMIQESKEESARRKSYENHIAELERKIKDDADEQRKDEKYKNSSLDEQDKSELLNKIIAVMEDSQEIFSQDFSVDALALLVGSKYKHVSQVINEKYNCNFNILLNKYRIREACKRMNDIENYGNYTIEAISASLGFKSRTTFVNSFKRETGLTPSEFQLLARDKYDAKK